MQKFLSNLNKNYFFVLIIIVQVFFTNPIVVFADLPNGNAVKDPNAILRNSLPIKQIELQDIQHRLEDTSDLVRGGRWPALTKTVTKCQSLFKKYNRSILEKIANENKTIAGNTLSDLKTDLDNLADIAKIKDKYAFINVRKEALEKIGKLEKFFLPNKFPYTIPSEFDDLPRLLGRANVQISTTKGDMEAIIDGYNAPLTGGAFIDLVSKNFYNDLPINRAEEFFVLQTGDPKGDDIGYVDPETNKGMYLWRSEFLESQKLFTMRPLKI